MQPKDTSNYFNFQFNCGRALPASYTTNTKRISDLVKEFTPLVYGENLKIERHHTIPQIVQLDISLPIIWFLGFSIHFSALGKHTAIPAPAGGDIWRTNFCKCGNETSHPNWVEWSPIPKLNSHLTNDFGEIQFSPVN